MLIESQPAAPPTPEAQVIRNAIEAAQEAANAAGQATVGAPPGARDMYLAAKAYRDELQDQWERLRDTRSSVARATREDNRTAADNAGLETRMAQLDERIVDVEKQIAAADARVAQAAGVPGATVEPPRPRDNRVDIEAVLTGAGFLTFALLFPFVIAFSRRIWRRSAKMTVTLPPEVATRIQAMEEAIEAVAVEVERIGEGQRFMTQALSESPRALGVGAAEPIVIRSREAALADRPL